MKDGFYLITHYLANFIVFGAFLGTIMFLIQRGIVEVIDNGVGNE